MSFRLTREAKIFKASEYAVIFKEGKLIKGKYWQLIAKPLKTSEPRLGLAISKKTHRLAVDRNRFKRIVREVFRLNKQHLGGWEFVVMARKSKPAKNLVLSLELLDLFNKIIKR